MKYVAVSTTTESGETDVFCVDFNSTEDVVESVKDIMGEDFYLTSKIQVHCPWGIEFEDQIVEALHESSKLIRQVSLS